MKRKIKETITRQDLIQLVSTQLKVGPKEVAPYVEATIEMISKLLRNAEYERRIELRGLGVFEVKNRKNDFRFRNPKTGETKLVKNSKKIHFKASEIIKRTLNSPQKKLSLLKD
ncbi:MAG: HU family DNA-binding protein [Chloroherpetonaceae bacterium]|nr:HU family DNA-binding protein [Chloroherpetonaceae bacterium]